MLSDHGIIVLRQRNGSPIDTARSTLLVPHEGERLALMGWRNRTLAQTGFALVAADELSDLCNPNVLAVVKSCCDGLGLDVAGQASSGVADVDEFEDQVRAIDAGLADTPLARDSVRNLGVVPRPYYYKHIFGREQPKVIDTSQSENWKNPQLD